MFGAILLSRRASVLIVRALEPKLAEPLITGRCGQRFAADTRLGETTCIASRVEKSSMRSHKEPKQTFALRTHVMT